MDAIEQFAGSDFRLVLIRPKNRVSVMALRGQTVTAGQAFDFPYADAEDVFTDLKRADSHTEAMQAIDMLGGVPC